MKHRSAISISGLTLCLLIVLLLNTKELKASRPGNDGIAETRYDLPDLPRIKNRSTLWSADQYGQLYISGGLSELFQYISFIGFRGSLDYQLSRRLSVGGQAALYYGNSQFKKQRTPLIGIRGDYHFVRPEYFRRHKRCDLYLGLSGDVYFGAGKAQNTPENISLKPDVHLGMRYQIARSWFLGGELGYRYGYFGLTFEIM